MNKKVITLSVHNWILEALDILTRCSWRNINILRLMVGISMRKFKHLQIIAPTYLIQITH